MDWIRVIFLDVDGVLNSHYFATKVFKDCGARVFREGLLDKRAIACLKQIVDQTGAIIVLSSTWRKIPEARALLVEQLLERNLIIHSDTPDAGKRRGDDISAWFEQHKDIDVESYVILDDDNDMNEHVSHLVQTSYYFLGLEAKHVQQAVNILMNAS